jgi:hypothetical protein
MAETPASPGPEPSTEGLASPAAAPEPVEAMAPTAEPPGEPLPPPSLETPFTPETPAMREAPAMPEADATPYASAIPEDPTPSAPPPAAPASAGEDGVGVGVVMEVVAQAVEVEAAGDAGEPRVATTLEVPPLPGGAAGSEGGEWELLLGKLRTWLEQADLPGQWDRLGGPLRGLGVLLGVLLVLKLYGALLATLDDLPLLPRLLQLVGLLALLRFSLTRLTRRSDRQVILDDWKRRWDAFSGS